MRVIPQTLLMLLMGRIYASDLMEMSAPIRGYSIRSGGLPTCRGMRYEP